MDDLVDHHLVAPDPIVELFDLVHRLEGEVEARQEERGAVGPATLRYVDSTLGALRSAGFSVEDAGYAFSLLDSFVYGHVTQEASASVPSTGEGDPPAGQGDYPYLAEVMEPGRGFSFDSAFEFGLELLLEALEARRVN